MSRGCLKGRHWKVIVQESGRHDWELREVWQGSREQQVCSRRHHSPTVARTSFRRSVPAPISEPRLWLPSTPSAYNEPGSGATFNALRPGCNLFNAPSYGKPAVGMRPIRCSRTPPRLFHRHGGFSSQARCELRVCDKPELSKRELERVTRYAIYATQQESPSTLFKAVVPPLHDDVTHGSHHCVSTLTVV